MEENLSDLQKKMEALERKLVENVHFVLEWIKRREEITRYIREATRTALSAGDASRLQEVVRSYIEIRNQSYAAMPILNEPNEDELTVVEAIAVVPAVYDLLDLWPEEALLHPVFGKTLVALRRGRNDSNVGSACQELLQVLAQKTAKPPKEMEEFQLLFRLRIYEFVLNLLQLLWKKHSRNLEQIYKDSPPIRALHESKTYVAEMKQRTPSWTAYNFLARSFNTNVNDLKRDLIKARKIKKALTGIEVEGIHTMDIADFLNLAAHRMGGFDTPFSRSLIKLFLGDSSQARS